jgi:hypothetical protein
MRMATRITTAFPSRPLPVMPATQAKGGTGAWAIAVTVCPRCLQWCRCGPYYQQWCQGHLHLPCPIATTKFARTLLSSERDVRCTPQAINGVGTPAAQIAGATEPWPSSALLWPVAMTVIVILVAGVCRQCHHPSKPVQTGGVVDQVDPAHASQVCQGAPSNGASTAATTIGQRGG